MYRNFGDRDAILVNFRDQLYAGRGRREPVVEMRHVSGTDSLFKMD